MGFLTYQLPTLPRFVAATAFTMDLTRVSLLSHSVSSSCRPGGCSVVGAGSGPILYEQILSSPFVSGGGIVHVQGHVVLGLGLDFWGLASFLLFLFNTSYCSNGLLHHQGSRSCTLSSCSWDEGCFDVLHCCLLSFFAVGLGSRSLEFSSFTLWEVLIIIQSPPLLRSSSWLSKYANKKYDADYDNVSANGNILFLL